MISTFVWMKWPTNVGNAIVALEQLFFEVATRSERELSREMQPPRLLTAVHNYRRVGWGIGREDSVIEPVKQ